MLKIENLENRRLSVVAQKEKLEPDNVSLYPGFPCAFRAVSTYVQKINQSYALMCGPQICLYNSKMHDDLKELNNYAKDSRLLHLTLEQEDIIMGFSTKIRAAIIEICSSMEMEILFIVTTCLCEIIGEDLDALIDEVQNEVKPRLLLIHTDNFSCEDCAPGIEKSMLVLENLMKNQTVQKKSVNLLGGMEREPFQTEMVRWLQKKAVSILNVLPEGGNPRDIEMAPAAALNIVTTHYGLPLAEKMKKQYGTPYLYIEKTFMPEAIAANYQQLAEALDIEVGEELQDLRQEAEQLIIQNRRFFEGKSCALSLLHGIQVGRYFDTVLFLTELGFDVKVVFIHELFPLDKTDIRRLLDRGIDPYVIKIGNYLVMEDMLRLTKPDYYFGSFESIKSVVQMGIETRQFGLCNHYFGFEIIEVFLNILKTSPPGLGALKYREMILQEGR